MELQEALRLFLQVDHAQSTRNTYRRVLQPFVTSIGPGRPLELIRPEDIDAYVFSLRQRKVKYAGHPTRPNEEAPLASATVYKHIKTIKRFFNWCVERELLTQSPTRFLVNRRPVRPLGEGKAATDEEVFRILDAARYKPRDLAILLLLVQSGARAGEVARLKISDLNLDECSAIVDGKGDKRRRIWFGQEAADAIRAWLERRPDVDHEHVFISWGTGRGPLTATGVSQIPRRLSRVCGLKRTLGAHAFRHFVGMSLARGKVPLTVIQHWLGHTDPQITMQYIRSIEPADIDAARDLLARIPKDINAHLFAFLGKSG